MKGHDITMVELLALQAFLGSPVILGAAAFVGYYLRRRKHRGYLVVLTACAAFVVSAIPTAAAFWIYWPFEVDIMMAEFVNVPAVVACSVLTSVAIWLAAYRAMWAHPCAEPDGG